MRTRLLLLLPLLSGCALVKSIADVQEPTLVFKDARLEEVDFEGATLDLTFTVTNPNTQTINLASASYALEVEGHAVVAGQPPGGLQIPGRASVDVILPARLVFRELAPALEAFWNKEQIGYRASGTLGINTPIGLVSVPIAHQGTFAPPHLPSVELGSPRLTGISLAGARLIIPIRLTNRNPFPLPLGAINGTLAVDGANVGAVALAQELAVAALTAQVIEIPLEVDFFSAGRAVAQAMQRGQAHFKMDGAVKSGNAQLPVHVEQDVQLQKQ